MQARTCVNVTIILFISLVADLVATPFDQDKSLEWYAKYYQPSNPKSKTDPYGHDDPWGKYKTDSNECGQYTLVGQIAGVPMVDGRNPLRDLLANWTTPVPQCGYSPTLYPSRLPKITDMAGELQRLGYDVDDYSGSQLDVWDEIRGMRGWRAGDIIFIYRSGGGGHAVVLKDPSTGDYWDHNGNENYTCWDDLANSLKQTAVTFTVIHRQARDKLADCKKLRQYETFDSSFATHYGGTSGLGVLPPSGDGRVTHSQVCCWHENLANTWPWHTNPSAYACLAWPDSTGMVWDSMISPRMNFAGDSAIRFWQSTYSTLEHNSGATIAVKGSTDNGLTWPFVLGGDELTDATLPWANGQRDVRIAWIYNGDPQRDRFWCIDNVEIWTKPTRKRDASISGVARPASIISQGRTITPSAFVWNHGLRIETLAVTMHIGANYTDARWVTLYPYDDTLLEFTPWQALPGTCTASAFCRVDSDECRANDTAALTLRVVADTWVDMGMVFGRQGTLPGACIASVRDSVMYATTGQKNFFARYLPEQNLWERRCPTLYNFNHGASLVYPGSGDYLYALRGDATSFCRYSMTGDTWTGMTAAPEKFRDGSGMAYGGNGCLYALRGGGSQQVFRYSIAADAWDTVAPFPYPVERGGAIVWGGGDYLYALRGDQMSNFYRYCISSNQWSERAQYLGQADAGASPSRAQWSTTTVPHARRAT